MQTYSSINGFSLHVADQIIVFQLRIKFELMRIVACPFSYSAYHTCGEVLNYLRPVFMIAVVLISLSVRIGAIAKHCLNNKIYYMAGSASGQHESNPAL